MAHEIELKLELPAKAASRLPKVPWLRKLLREPPRRKRVTSVYFDTRSGKLRQAGISLRVRRQGNKILQTIKHANGAGASFKRQEWEWKIDEDRPNLKLAKDTLLGQFNLKKLRRKLRPIFETDVRRSTMRVGKGATELEIAIDNGT